MRKPGRQSHRKERAKADALDEASLELPRDLKKLRPTLSQDRAVPAYVIFSDKTLIDMAGRRPADLAALSNVNFHCSPAASDDDDGSYCIGAVTATASFRFARWLERWFALSGARVIIGKGGMPEGSESHFKLVVVSDEFAGVPRIGRHKMINRLLAPEFAAGLHALAMETHTVEEWQARGARAAETPPCLGGGKAGA